MTIESKLKEYVLDRYKSIREFTQEIGMSYSTFDSILRRGVSNSSITNILKICEGLGISADELADGRITPVALNKKIGSTEVIDILEDTKSKLKHYDNLTFDGNPIGENEIISLINTIDVGIGLVKKSQQKG